MICIPSRSKFLPFVRSSFVQRHYRYRCTRISSFLHWFWRIDQVHVLFFLQLESCPHPTSAVFQHGNNLVPRMMKAGHSFNLLPSQPNTPLIMLSNSSNIFCSEWPSLEPSEYQLLFLLRQPSYLMWNLALCYLVCRFLAKGSDLPEQASFHRVLRQVFVPHFYSCKLCDCRFYVGSTNKRLVFSLVSPYRHVLRLYSCKNTMRSISGFWYPRYLIKHNETKRNENN